MPDTPILALTATATAFYQTEIKRSSVIKFHPPGSPPHFSNRLFVQKHAQYLEEYHNCLVQSLISGTAVAQVPFVTVAFGLCIDKKTDVPTVERMIHIGIPYTMEKFFRETGRPGRNGNHAVLLIFFLIQTDNKQLLNHAGER